MAHSPRKRAVLGSALTALALSTPATSALPDPGEPWIEVRSGHFLLLSNAGEVKTAEIARGLECFRAVLAPVTAALGRDVPVPDEVVVFRGDRSFRPYSPSPKASRTAAAAFFARRLWGSLIAVNAYPGYERFRSVSTLYAGYADFIADAAFADLPWWPAAGLTDYYSTFGLLAGEAIVGEAHPQHAWWLERRSFLPWEEVLSAGRGPDGGEPEDEETAGALRAQSWLLVHYLLSRDEESPGRFAELLHRLAAGAAGTDALQELYGLTPEAMSSSLRGYVNRRGYPFRAIPVEELMPAPSHEVRELPRAEVLVRLGEVLLFRGTDGLAAAEEHFRAALEVEPTHPEAHTGLARVALQRGDRDGAEAHFREAVTRGSRSSVSYVLYADLLLQELLESGEAAGGETAASVARRARELLEQAAVLEPALPWREALLGVTFFYQGEEVEAGIEHLRRARELLPNRPELAYNLAQLHLRRGDLEAARQLLEAELRSGDRTDLAQRLEGAIERELLTRAENAARRADAETVAEISRQALAGTPDPERAAALEERLGAIAEEARERRGHASYDRALELFDRGQLAAALAELRRLLAETEDAELRQAARELAEQIEEVLP